MWIDKILGKIKLAFFKIKRANNPQGFGIMVEEYPLMRNSSPVLWSNYFDALNYSKEMDGQDIRIVYQVWNNKLNHLTVHEVALSE